MFLVHGNLVINVFVPQNQVNIVSGPLKSGDSGPLKLPNYVIFFYYYFRIIIYVIRANVTDTIILHRPFHFPPTWLNHVDKYE